MKKALSRLWREPLLHFLLIGVALFVYYDLDGENVETPPKSIQVERGQVEQLVANFQRTWSRPPSAEELDAMIESFVREEVFYREALAMGLDRDDPMVRRRLRMKLEFMLEDLALQDVDDALLNGFLAENPDRFRTEPTTSFQQVFVDPVRHPQLESDAADWLAQLRNGVDPESLGDPTLTPRALELARQSEIARLFGAEFAAQIVSLPIAEWIGPIGSPFGAHLVRIDERVEPRLPALAEIRDQVLRDYQAEQQQQRKEQVYQRLRDGYEVSVAPLSATDTAQ